MKLTFASAVLLQAPIIFALGSELLKFLGNELRRNDELARGLSQTNEILGGIVKIANGVSQLADPQNQLAISQHPEIVPQQLSSAQLTLPPAIDSSPQNQPPTIVIQNLHVHTHPGTVTVDQPVRVTEVSAAESSHDTAVTAGDRRATPSKPRSRRPRHREMPAEVPALPPVPQALPSNTVHPSSARSSDTHSSYTHSSGSHSSDGDHPNVALTSYRQVPIRDNPRLKRTIDDFGIVSEKDFNAAQERFKRNMKRKKLSGEQIAFYMVALRRDSDAATQYNQVLGQDCAIDTCSSHNLIPLSIVENEGWQSNIKDHEEGRIEFQTFCEDSPNRISTMGTLELLVGLAETETTRRATWYKVIFHVVDDRNASLSFPVLVGSPFLVRYQARIFWKSQPHAELTIGNTRHSCTTANGILVTQILLRSLNDRPRGVAECPAPDPKYQDTLWKYKVEDLKARTAAIKDGHVSLDFSRIQTNNYTQIQTDNSQTTIINNNYVSPVSPVSPNGLIAETFSAATSSYASTCDVSLTQSQDGAGTLILPRSPECQKSESRSSTEPMDVAASTLSPASMPSSASMQPKSNRKCWNWEYDGTCCWGAGCYFKHSTEDGQTRAQSEMSSGTAFLAPPRRRTEAMDEEDAIVWHDCMET